MRAVLVAFLLALFGSCVVQAAVSSHWVLVRVPVKAANNNNTISKQLPFFGVDEPSVLSTRMVTEECPTRSFGICSRGHSDVPVLCSALHWMGEEDLSEEVRHTCLLDTVMDVAGGYTIYASSGAETVPMYFISESDVTHKALTFHDDAPHSHSHSPLETEVHAHPHTLRNVVEWSVIIPDSFTHVAIRSNADKTKALVFAGDSSLQKRLFRAQETPEEIAANRGIVVTRHQHLNPKGTRSVTFLASGYLAGDKAKFLADVDTAMAVLRDNKASRYSPAPWDRYFYLFNIYSVFEPSVQSGASRPNGPGYSCPGYMNDCGPSSVNNNLQCAFGTPVPSRLGCSYERAKALASFSPASDIIVVLVNDKDYGGTGSDRYCVLSVGSSDFPYLLIHEIAHSVGLLGDEYTYGFSDYSGISLPNCARTNAASELPWKVFSDAGKVPTTPFSGCSFDNYYRPTDESCIMKSGDPSTLCPVCMDAVATRMLTVSPGLSLAAPICPHESFVIYLESGESAILTVNHRFLLLNTDVAITWTLPGGASYTGAPFLTVPASALVSGINTVTAVIEDKNPAMPSSTRTARATQSVEFKLALKTPADVSLTTSTCVDSSGSSHTYTGVCTNPDGCTRETVISLYDAKVSSALTEDDASKAVKASAVIFAVIGLIAIVASFAFICYKKKTSPQSVYDFGTVARSVWIAAGVFACFVLIAVCCAIVYVVQYLPETVMFGEALFIAGLVIAILIYLVTLGTFVSILTLSALFNTIFSILLTLLAIAIFIVCMVMGDLVINREEKDTVEKLAGLWRDTVKDDSSLACTMQNYFGCSGYYYSCTPVLSEYCPSNCDTHNRNPNACLTVWQQFMWDKFLPASVCGVVLACLMVVTAILTIVLCVLKRQATASAAGRRSHRKDARAPVRALTKRERAQLRQEFEKADKNGNGTLEGDEVLKFVSAVFPSDTIALDEAQELIAGGPKTFEQIVAAYFPFLEQQTKDPRLLTHAEAEDAANLIDLHRRQQEKLDKFTAASGALSPEALEGLYAKHRDAYYNGRPTSSSSPRAPSTGRRSASPRQDPNVPADAEMSPREGVITADLDGDGVDDIDGNAMLSDIQQEAKKYAATLEGQMLQSLSPQEVDGLRSAWRNLHPAVAGHLTDPEIDRYYQWSHEAVLESREHFVRWKQMLNVRNTGRIGWAEFCFPYAQRSLLRQAKASLQAAGKDVAVRNEYMSREVVTADFGEDVANTVFLPYELEAPLERVVAASISSATQ